MRLGKSKRRGLTLLEVMIAMFIFMVGIVGVLAALPAGITSAELVIFQDAAIHLAHSKFAEFRRDRINPTVDLPAGSSYLVNRHGNATSEGGYDWRKFHYPNAGDANQFDNDTYQYFDDIERYIWRVDPVAVTEEIVGSVHRPLHRPGGNAIGDLVKTKIVVRLKGSRREFAFTQYIYSYDWESKNW